MIRKIKRVLIISLRSLPIFRMNKNLNPIKWGIIGLGNMAEVFASAIDGNKDGIVFAVASRDIEKAKSFARKHSCKNAYGSYEEMIYDESLALDVIYIATPVKFHYDHIKLCLLAGKNVICEKPITSNATQLEELVSIAKNNNCFLMEGMWMKCLTSFQKAKEWIKTGKIGKVELVKVDFYKRELIRPELTIFNSNEGGGALKDFGVYAISFATSFIGGIPNKIFSNSRISPMNIDTDWQIFLKKNNVKAFISISSNFSSLSKAIIVGTAGSIEWDSQFNRANRITLYDSFGVLKDVFIAKYEFEGFEHEINEVQKCIKAGLKESNLVPISESYDTIKVIDKIFFKKGVL
jgi:predicted dehydrogenase